MVAVLRYASNFACAPPHVPGPPLDLGPAPAAVAAASSGPRVALLYSCVDGASAKAQFELLI